MILDRAVAGKGNEDQDVGDGTQQVGCSGIEAAPQNTGDGEPSEENMAQFAKAIHLYQKKEHRCFQCWSANHLIHDCPKDLDHTAGVTLNSKEGMATKGA